MVIDWHLIARYAAPLLAVFVGIAISRWLERRPRLVMFLAHAAAINVPSDPPMTVHTHSIVVRNAGGRVASNIRLGHNMLPAFSVYPPQPYEVVDIIGGEEIVIPKLVPKEQITIAYLYMPPIIWSQVNTYTKSDEGFAHVLNVLPTQQFPRWLSVLLWFFIAIGALATAIALSEFTFRLLRLVYGG